MGRVHGIGFQRLFAFQGAVQHQVGIGGGKATINVYRHFGKSGHHTHQRLKILLDGNFYILLLLLRQFGVQGPKDNVLDHKYCVYIL